MKKLFKLVNLERAVFTGKSQASAYHINLAVARSIRQGLGLRYSCKDIIDHYSRLNK